MTGGAQLDGFIALVHELLTEAGLDAASVFTERAATIVPGFYRPTKAWDLVAVARGELVACIEVKSQAGPSYGNNFNNRIEEALGSATDFWKAYEQDGFPGSGRPFLGYVMLLEEDSRSTSPVGVQEPHFTVRPEFQGASYAQRYQLFGQKLLRDRLYDAAAFLMSGKAAQKTGQFREPSPELTFGAFAAALMGKAYAFSKRV